MKDANFCFQFFRTDSQPKSPASGKKASQVNKEKNKHIKESAKKQKEDSDDGESEGEEDVEMASGDDDDSTDEEAQVLQFLNY